MADDARPWSSPDVIYDELGMTFSYLPWPGIVGQITRPRLIDLEVADVVTEPMLELMEERFPDAPRYDILHDWSATTGYLTQARIKMTKWVITRREKIGRIVIVPSATETTIMKMGMTTAAMAFRPFGISIDSADDVDAGFQDLQSTRTQ